MTRRSILLRTQLTEKLDRQGAIRSKAVREAMQVTPREQFADWLSLEDAYADRAFTNPNTKHDSTISQPTAVALMLEAFDIAKSMNVLEIGAGTGYNAALMSYSVGKGGCITSLDIEADLICKAQENLQAYTNINLYTADGALGYPPHAPYDRIVATVGFWDAPFVYLQQLKPEGCFVAPLWLLGEPQDYVLVSLQNKRTHFEGHGITGLRMVIMRGINAPKHDTLDVKTGKAFQGSSLETLTLKIYPRDLAPPLKANQKHIYKPNSVTVLESA